MLDILKQRVASLLAAVEQSAGQHNALLGRLAEAKELVAKLEADAAAAISDGKAIIDLVEGKEHAA